jgi:predicted nicotinamide N-methyase
LSLRRSGAEEEEALLLRNLRPMFEEASLVDQGAAVVEFRCRGGSSSWAGAVLAVAQKPRLAARLDGEWAPNADGLGSPTEASSATGAVIWDSAFVVARVLEHHTNLGAQEGNGGSAGAAAARRNPLCVRGQAVFELGAGCGLLSALVWRLEAARVTASERPELLPLLAENLRQNCSPAAAAGDPRPARPPPRVLPHLWGDPLPEDGGGAAAQAYDLVVAVDCVYDEASVAPLLASMRALGVGRDATVGLVAVDSAYKRPKARAAFFDALAGLKLRATEVRGVEEACGEDFRESVLLWLIDSIEFLF